MSPCPIFSPPTLSKARWLSWWNSQTGRKLEILRATPHFKLFPNIAVSLDNITLSNPPGMEGDPLVRMSSSARQSEAHAFVQGQGRRLTACRSSNRNSTCWWTKKAGAIGTFNTPGKSSRLQLRSKHNGQSDKALSLGVVTIKDGLCAFHQSAKRRLTKRSKP